MKELQSLDDIFNKKIFRIPDYQRGYAWGEKQLIEFWEDLISLDKNRSHYTGVLSIKAVPESVWESWIDERWLIESRGVSPYFIVDGQQRLTTISIFIQCLIESVKSLHENIGLAESEIYLGSYELKTIIESYIVVQEPKHKIQNTYRFGYAVDNPSFDFLRHRIFNAPHEPAIKETFYTLNLENAKSFLSNNIQKLVKDKGLTALEDLYTKLTQRFLFNLYEIDDKFDVFVAFETMNNRGKKLSDLELLKNRLIYLTTLYPSHEVDDDAKEVARKNINDTWAEIYNQLGRNKKHPLNDDDFLRAHWIMYFKYSRNTGSDYIKHLLDDYFSPKNLFDKVELVPLGQNQAQELTDSDDSILDEEDAVKEEISTVKIKLNVKEINDYVNSLKSAAQAWYSTWFPDDVTTLSNDEKLYMDKINRVKVGYFRPLIMSVFLKVDQADPMRLEFLKAVERFIFINFRLCRAQSNYGSSHFYRRARDIYRDDQSLTQVILELYEYSNWATNDDKDNEPFNTKMFNAFIDKKFTSKSGDGFYGWNDLRYFLFEYEEHLKSFRGQAKIGWSNFVKSESDRVSIEHILPQTDENNYWVERYSNFDEKQIKILKGSLGNLLPLSSSINSSLQNDSFPDKKNGKRDEKGNTIRNGYSNGSYSELEVAHVPDWTAAEIKKRGLKLLAFMESRWDINLGSEAAKLELLHLSFLDIPENEVENEEATL